MPTFSERNNLRTTNIPISIRNDAPDSFRRWLISKTKGLLSIHTILTVICDRTYQGDDGNWGEKYIENEAIEKLLNCEWYLVYDVVESFYNLLSPSKRDEYANEINSYFCVNGYGWKLENGLIQYRGNPVEERNINAAIEVLGNNSQTAQNELKSALSDLSRRPNPDISGTLHHAMGAMECFIGTIFGNTNKTLGELIKTYRHSIPQPLDSVIEKLWGYTSNYGRHVHEGKTATFEEAELTLNISSAIILYISNLQKNHRITNESLI